MRWEKVKEENPRPVISKAFKAPCMPKSYEKAAEISEGWAFKKKKQMSEIDMIPGDEKKNMQIRFACFKAGPRVVPGLY